MKMQSKYLHFKHPNILRTWDEISQLNFFLESITPKHPRRSTSEVDKMLGSLKCKYADYNFIGRCLSMLIL